VLLYGVAKGLEVADVAWGDRIVDRLLVVEETIVDHTVVEMIVEEVQDLHDTLMDLEGLEVTVDRLAPMVGHLTMKLCTSSKSSTFNPLSPH
jgi:hypothetical protein